MQLRKMILLGMIIALSVVGAMIKVPIGSLGTLAFDSMPAFVLSGLIGPLYGGLAGGFGHMVTAYLAGFPLGLPVHLLIAFMMILSVACFGLVYRRVGKFPGIVAGVLMNGVVSLLPFIPILGMGFVLGSMLPLILVSLANILIAVAVITVLSKALKGNRTYDTLTGSYNG